MSLLSMVQALLQGSHGQGSGIPPGQCLGRQGLGSSE